MSNYVVEERPTVEYWREWMTLSGEGWGTRPDWEVIDVFEYEVEAEATKLYYESLPKNQGYEYRFRPVEE